MAKISPEQIEKMCQLYAEIGVYSKVAKMVGSSPATVKKYVSLYSQSSNTPSARKEDIIHFDGNIPPVESISIQQFMNSILCAQNVAEEIDELKQLWEEI